MHKLQRLEEVVWQLAKKKPEQKKKPLSRRRYDRGLRSLNPKLQSQPIKSSNLKKTVQSKLPRVLPLSNVCNLKQKPRSQRHLGKLFFRNTVLSIRVTMIAIL